MLRDVIFLVRLQGKSLLGVKGLTGKPRPYFVDCPNQLTYYILCTGQSANVILCFSVCHVRNCERCFPGRRHECQSCKYNFAKTSAQHCVKICPPGTRKTYDNVMHELKCEAYPVSGMKSNLVPRLFHLPAPAPGEKEPGNEVGMKGSQCGHGSICFFLWIPPKWRSSGDGD